VAARLVGLNWVACRSTVLAFLCIVSPVHGAEAQTVVDLLESLRGHGANIIYSSDLLDPNARIPGSATATDPWERVRQSLAALGLELKPLGPDRYAVVRSSGVIPSAQPAPADVRPATPEQLQEVSVYASRYTFGRDSIAEAKLLGQSQIQSTPGARDDALRSVRVVPGLATNASTRPYIRGSVADDVLVLFDGVPLADPFHLKNFQSLISAFDREAIERIEIYSGGFPVKYGTRSGGVMDIAPRALESGYENTFGVSLLAYDVASVGQSERWPVDWLVTVRHGVSDYVLKPVNGHVGEPQFSDTLGRLRWRFDNDAALTLGWLLLDDEIALASGSLDERADASYRDEYGWLAFEASPGERWHSRTVISGTWADRSRTGSLQAPGFADEVLDEAREFSTVEFQSQLSFVPRAGQSWDASLEASRSQADLTYTRNGAFSPAAAALFDRPIDNTRVGAGNPRVSTLGGSLSHSRKWSSFEAELGVRWDEQSYRGERSQSQLSPRLNLRYDMRPDLRAYASWGRFSQAQRVYEWRTEDGQMRPDNAAVATHTIVGVAYELPQSLHVTLEAYRKHWSAVAPYYDNLFTTLSLVPDLQPDRQLIAPRFSEARGVELSARRAISDSLTFWAAYTYSRATDDLGVSRDVPRSWDQPHAVSAGANWNSGNWKSALLVGWHTGWPHAPFTNEGGTASFGNDPTDVRNSTRWGSYFTLDLSGAWTRHFRSSDLEIWADLTNATDRSNACCLHLIAPSDQQAQPAAENNAWLPRTLNVGFTWRWHGRREDG